MESDNIAQKPRKEERVKPLRVEYMPKAAYLSIFLNIVMAAVLVFFSVSYATIGMDLADGTNIQMVEYDNSTANGVTTFYVKLTNLGNEIGEERIYYAVEVGTTNTTKSDLVRMAPGETSTFTFRIVHNAANADVTEVSSWI